jgi:hypothetical protein
MFFLLKRVQARVKGLITRNKVRSMARHRKFMPNDSYNKYTTVNNSKIVSYHQEIKLINFLDRGSNQKTVSEVQDSRRRSQRSVKTER